MLSESRGLSPLMPKASCCRIEGAEGIYGQGTQSVRGSIMINIDNHKNSDHRKF